MIKGLNLKDVNPAFLKKGYYYMDAGTGLKDTFELTKEHAAARAHGFLLMANTLNDMASTFGINTLHLPGDMLLCKLNLVKMKKPRRNPSYRKL